MLNGKIKPSNRDNENIVFYQNTDLLFLGKNYRINKDKARKILI